ncbi:hypothetical protein JVX90_00100 [Gordonia sp. PDNC005]|uniref:hypothetical protein n=1 Tax=Gordonia sp. PDNC005 TaxID=2811424 RepID=UPI0019647FD8|nr:hypothetical protein [Gordonia sp. PDNC005]QRY62714.1 hypothetical protein JVX90_00100 [Gordonia sp. PDNC005]
MTSINASEHSITAATAALGRAALFDDRITAGDTARIAAWAEAIEPFGIETPDALAAVTTHYQATNADTIRVGNLIAAARKIRGERAEREKGTQIAAQLPPPDPQLAGLPIAGADGNPIWPAYEHYNAIEIPCTTCGAQPEEACTNPITQTARKIPCVTRVSTARKAQDQP